MKNDAITRKILGEIYVDLKKIAEADIDYEEEVQPMWNQLYAVIHETISAMYKKNEETRKNTRSFVQTPL